MNKRFLIASCLFLAVGCQFDPSEIRFNASAYSTESRTSYEGTVVDGDTERINWVENQDRITIYSPETEGKTADYDVISVSNRSATVSQAGLVPGINPSTGSRNGLVWANNGPHTFLAMYPAASILDAADAEDFSLTDSRATWRIPAAQTLTRRSDTDLYYPDMRFATMLARASGTVSDAAITLPFQPAFTAFAFSMSAGDNDVVHLTSFSMTTGAEGGALAGTMEAVPQTSDNLYPTRTEGWSLVDGTGSAAVTVDFTSLPGGKLTLTRDAAAVTITVLALPLPIDQLTLTFTGDEFGTCRLRLARTDNNWVQFAACKKHWIDISFPRLDQFDATGGNIHWTGAVGEELYWHGAEGENITWKN